MIGVSLRPKKVREVTSLVHRPSNASRLCHEEKNKTSLEEAREFQWESQSALVNNGRLPCQLNVKRRVCVLSEVNSHNVAPSDCGRIMNKPNF